MGRTLQLHVLSRCLRMVLLCEAIVCTAFVGMDSASIMRDVFSRPDGLRLGLEVFVLKLPLTIYLTLPVALLVGCLLVIGQMKRDGELLGICGAGVSWGEISVPFLACGFAASLGIAALSELLIPPSTRQLDRIMTSQLKRFNVLWTFYHRPPSFYRLGDCILFLHGRPRPGVLGKITIFEMDEDFALRRRLDAENAFYRGGKWILKDATEAMFEPDGGLTKESVAAEMQYPLEASPGDFTAVSGGPFETTYAQLRELIDLRRSKGLITDRYMEDLHMKLSHPLSAAVGAFLVAPAASLQAFNGTLTRSLLSGGVLGFAYWTLQAAAVVFGRAGLFGPATRCWAADAAFCIAGLCFYLIEALRVRRRNG